MQTLYVVGKFGKHDANTVPKVTALHSKGKMFQADANLRQLRYLRCNR